MGNTQTRQAIAYLRTSSAANIGPDKDSQRRQREAVSRYAKSAGFELCDEYSDLAVKGADEIETRPGFAAMLDRIEGNGVRTIIVEDASRFARSMLAQELGVMLLHKRGVTVLASNGDNLTETDDPMKVLMRQVGAAFSQYEKARLVGKLKGARDRKSAELKRRCEGRKPVPDAVVALAKQLVRDPKTRRRRSLRTIAAGLAAAGHTVPGKDSQPSGRPYAAESVKLMLARRA
jgi:DNA invertase Pin-like site-specific DNA recombinase